MSTIDPTSPSKKVARSARRLERRKGEVASVKSELRSVYVQTADAEERTLFLERLVKGGFGTKDVENYEGNQANMRFGANKGIRDENAIKEDMERKLRNSKEDAAKMRKKRGRLRKKLEDLIGNRSDNYKEYIKKVKEKVKRLKKKAQDQNNNKIERLGPSQRWKRKILICLKDGKDMRKSKRLQGWI